ncbi:MAG TPA: hydantoinase/oxoprolinase family protein [Stellaceae bacterium]|nr:hydantoinase/oxoprolinase family protein [Stellaceae bacterium]
MTGAIRFAVDIGGTFTDLQLVDEATGRVAAYKLPTTPEDPSIGLIDGIRGACARHGLALDRVEVVMHGTTIATNAVLQRRLPEGALITTAGFEDVLEIGRHARRDVYGLKAEPRTLLIPRHRRFGVVERIGADGRMIAPLDEAAATDLARRIATSGWPVVAVALLHAYANPIHERRLREIIEREAPGVEISLSSEISPEIREFERTSTTVLNALLMPVVRGYTRRLEARLAEAEFKPLLYLVQSNGGATTPARAGLEPARLLLSGPSGGALAAELIAAELDLPNLIAVDMGGTSYDISVILAGRRNVVAAGEVDGCPVRLPMVEMRTIGAGGGSIAWLDGAKRLHVGPESAGAVPGPVCYGRGGTRPTVTDANVVLGRLDPAHFLGGAMRLDKAAAASALDAHVAQPLGLDIDRAAEGVLTVTVSKLATAIKLSLFEKGLDPADFALISFGGAGGLHAVEVAGELGIKTVVFPLNPGTLSAYGILMSDLVHDLSRSRLMRLTPDCLPALRALADGLAVEGRAILDGEAVPADRQDLAFTADLRYQGQAFELLIPVPAQPLDAALIDLLAERFHVLHEQRFSYADRTVPVELVTLRLTATGRLGKPPVAAMAADGIAAEPTERPMRLGGAWQQVPVHQRAAIPTGDVLRGPLMVEEEYTSILITGGWTVESTGAGHLVAHREIAR